MQNIGCHDHPVTGHVEHNKVASRVERVFSGQSAIHIHASQILLRTEGRKAITRSVGKVAKAIGADVRELVGHLFNNMYFVAPSGILVLVIMLPRFGVEMYAEVPSAMWTFKTESEQVH